MAASGEEDLTYKPHSQQAGRPSPSSLNVPTNDESITATLHTNSPANSPPQKNEFSDGTLAHDSQPMTKTVSSSSIPSGMDTSTGDNVGPSPYGTRSRNKAGNARPNYAEDREIDTEPDGALTKKSQASSGAVALGPAQAGDGDRSSGMNTRRSSNAASGSATSKAGPASNAKEGIPGMSSFPLNSEAASPLPTTSKKRKAPGGRVATSTTSPQPGQPASHGSSRKTMTTVSSARHRETNMLTFESSQGFLKDGKLKADDGTILGINGESTNVPVYSSPHVLIMC